MIVLYYYTGGLNMKMAAHCKLKDNKTSPEVREHRKFLITWGVLKQTSKKCHQDRGSMPSEYMSLLN